MKAQKRSSNQTQNLDRYQPGQFVRHAASSDHVFVVIADFPSDDDKLVYCVSPYELILRKYERKLLKLTEVDPDWLRNDARTRELPEAPTGWMTADEIARMLNGI